MRCLSCGFENPERMNYCGICGALPKNRSLQCVVEHRQYQEQLLITTCLTPKILGLLFQPIPENSTAKPVQSFDQLLWYNHPVTPTTEYESRSLGDEIFRSSPGDQPSPERESQTWLLPPQAAEAAGVSLRTVERWIADGRLKVEERPAVVYLPHISLSDVLALRDAPKPKGGRPPGSKTQNP